MNEGFKTLTDIFSGTDNVCYGPFAVIKDAGAPFDNAYFMVDDLEVPLGGIQKRVMALLISQRGRTLNVQHFAAGMQTDYFNDIAEDIRRPESYTARRQAIRDGKAAYKEQIELIQAAIGKAFGPGTPEAIHYQNAFEFTRGYSLRPAGRDLKSGFRLNVPDLAKGPVDDPSPIL